MTKKAFYIVIINWNGKDLTLKCLESLKKALKGEKDIQVVLVDNYSMDDSIQAFKKLSFPFDFHLITNKKNLGWTGGHNVGIRYALKQKASAILLLANDSIVYPGFITEIKKILYSTESIGIVSPKIYQINKGEKIIYNAGNNLNKWTYQGYEFGNGEKDKGQYNNILKTDYVAGTALTAKREVFEKIGFFDERLFLYYEDMDFCFRAKKAGFSCAFAQKSIISHHGAATTKVGSPLHTYYNARNRLLFLEKHAPFYVILREYLILFPKILRFLLRRNREWKKYYLLGVRDYFLRRFGRRIYW